MYDFVLLCSRERRRKIRKRGRVKLRKRIGGGEREQSATEEKKKTLEKNQKGAAKKGWLVE
jgi:hypothetical protein